MTNFHSLSQVARQKPPTFGEDRQHRQNGQPYRPGSAECCCMLDLGKQCHSKVIFLMSIYTKSTEITILFFKLNYL